MLITQPGFLQGRNAGQNWSRISGRLLRELLNLWTGSGLLGLQHLNKSSDESSLSGLWLELESFCFLVLLMKFWSQSSAAVLTVLQVPSLYELLSRAGCCDSSPVPTWRGPAASRTSPSPTPGCSSACKQNRVGSVQHKTPGRDRTGPDRVSSFGPGWRLKVGLLATDQRQSGRYSAFL